MALAADLGLAYGKDCINGTDCTSVATASVNNVLDEAECLCDPPDLWVYIKVTKALPQATSALQVWVGSSCDQQTNRLSTSNVCEQVKDSSL